MYTVETGSSPENRNRFAAVVDPFLQQPALPFAGVLTAESIERAFAESNSLFGERDIFSTPIVLWAFLAQVLGGDNGTGSFIDGVYSSLMTAQDGIDGFHIGTGYAVAYHYDNAGTSGQLTGTGRFERITGPGLPAYGVHYSYTAGSNLLSG